MNEITAQDMSSTSPGMWVVATCPYDGEDLGQDDTCFWCEECGRNWNLDGSPEVG